MNLLMVSSGEELNESFVTHLRSIYEAPRSRTIGYVTFNKTYASVVEIFDREGFDPSRFHIIDGITTSVTKSPEKKENCTYLQKPRATEALADCIMDEVVTRAISHLVVDSLSILFFYSSREEVLAFIGRLTTSLSHNHIDSVFVILRSDLAGAGKTIMGLFDSVVGMDKDSGKQLSAATELLVEGFVAVQEGRKDDALQAYLKLKIDYKKFPSSVKTKIYDRSLELRKLIQEELALKLPGV